MKRLIVHGAGCVAVAAAAATTALLGAGTAAAAPDVVGMQYSDAVSKIEDGGGTAKVAVKVGTHANQDECLVTNAWDAPFVHDSGGSFEHADGEVLVALNCEGGYATAFHSGPSAASPEAKASKAAEEAAAEQSGQ